jgi:dTDP-glucose pyrophosphorylase
MIDLKSIIIAEDATVLDAIKVMDSSNLRIGFGIILDGESKLIGVVTDGDVRRGLLCGVRLDDSVNSIMSTTPIIAHKSEKRPDIIRRLGDYRINHMPVLDDNGIVVGIETSDLYFVSNEKNIPVIIMVGGYGKRLRPMTNDCPKPMLKLGQTPLLDLILRSLISSGFRSFWLAVNYKRETIKDYFKDGSQLGVSIKYLEEEKRLGTAGALALYAHQSVAEDVPVLVMNGDVLTDINYDSLVQTYERNECDAVICIKEYSYELPYGAVEIEEDRLISITEKPKYAFYVNSGIYMLNSKLLRLVPDNKYYDMTTFLEDLLVQNFFVSAFLIREYWLDVGSKENFEEAATRVDYV